LPVVSRNPHPPAAALATKVHRQLYPIGSTIQLTCLVTLSSWALRCTSLQAACPAELVVPPTRPIQLNQRSLLYTATLPAPHSYRSPINCPLLVRSPPHHRAAADPSSLHSFAPSLSLSKNQHIYPALHSLITSVPILRKKTAVHSDLKHSRIPDFNERTTSYETVSTYNTWRVGNCDCNICCFSRFSRSQCSPPSIFYSHCYSLIGVVLLVDTACHGIFRYIATILLSYCNCNNGYYQN
jgi:hypothetical protein